MNKEKTAIVLLSGGLDSVCALYHAQTEYQVTHTLSFDYGSKHNHQEIGFATWHAATLGISHTIIPLHFMNEYFSSALLKSGGGIPDGHYEEENMKQTVVPFRNGIMLSVAAGYAESHNSNTLIIGAHSGDHAIYPDCRENFMLAMGQAIELGTYENIHLMRPFIEMTKKDIVLRGNQLGIDFSKTWSCYKGGNIHCGSCGTCIERREAFLLAGVEDPTTYEQTPPIEKKS